MAEKIEMGARYAETEQGKIPDFVEIRTKSPERGRERFLRDVAQEILEKQGILKKGQYVRWSNFHPTNWAGRAEGVLPDGREVEFWYMQQREYTWYQESEDGPLEWKLTDWHSLRDSRSLPEIYQGDEYVEYRFSGQFKKAS